LDAEFDEILDIPIAPPRLLEPALDHISPSLADGLKEDMPAEDVDSSASDEPALQRFQERLRNSCHNANLNLLHAPSTVYLDLLAAPGGADVTPKPECAVADELPTTREPEEAQDVDMPTSSELMMTATSPVVHVEDVETPEMSPTRRCNDSCGSDRCKCM